MPTMIPGCFGRPTIDGKTARGASSPAKPALHMPDPERGDRKWWGEWDVKDLSGPRRNRIIFTKEKHSTSTAKKYRRISQLMYRYHKQELEFRLRPFLFSFKKLSKCWKYNLETIRTNRYGCVACFCVVAEAVQERRKKFPGQILAFWTLKYDLRLQNIVISIRDLHSCQEKISLKFGKQMVKGSAVYWSK